MTIEFVKKTPMSPSLSSRVPFTSRRSFLKSSLLAVTAASLSSCSSRDNAVVVYVSVDDVLARELLAACTSATGVEVLPVFDTEATKTTGLENRIRSEANRPRADIFWSSEAFATARLASDGYLQPLPAGLVDRWPQAHRDTQGRWIAFAARARVIAYRSDRSASTSPSAAPRTIPETWAALADPALRTANFAGIAIADPRFGTTRGHMAALDAAWSAARLDLGERATAETPTLESWIAGLRANGVKVLSGGNAATVDAVASGEVTFGCTDTDDVFAAQARGLPVAFLVPRTLPQGLDGGGTMLVPNTVGLVAGRPKRPEVEAVLHWIASAECERLICSSPSRNLPIGPEAAMVATECASAFAEADPLVFDVAALSRRVDEIAARSRVLLQADSPVGMRSLNAARDSEKV